jgi:hypothetical protein
VDSFPHCTIGARRRVVDPAEVDGPGAEWYRELAETENRPWPRLEVFARWSHAVGIARALPAPPWPCRKCGGPQYCPDLRSTLPYRCGYVELVDGRWLHE